MADRTVRWWQTLTTVEAGRVALADPVVVLSVAAIEQHGPHLPLSTDLDIGLGLLSEAFGRIPEDFPAWALPPQAIGCSREHARFAGTLSVEPEQLSALIEATGEVLAHIGVRRLVLSNSHGGNRHALEIAGLRLRDELGMLVDVSHLNERGFWDTLEHSTAPVVASHSCCRALCDHTRNLTDKQLQALGSAGGVVGITFVPSFVDTEAPSLDGLVDHIVHAVDVAGATAVGLGSDFDGGGDLLAHGGELPGITEALLSRGVDDNIVRGILGANHLRLLRQTID